METKIENKMEHECCKSKKPGKNFIAILSLIMVAAILMVSAVQSFQIKELNNKIASITGAAVNSNNANGANGIDMTGWTDDEKMMYEHHGTPPSRLKNSVQSPAKNSMVGGC